MRFLSKTNSIPRDNCKNPIFQNIQLEFFQLLFPIFEQADFQNCVLIFLKKKKKLCTHGSIPKTLEQTPTHPPPRNLENSQKHGRDECLQSPPSAFAGRTRGIGPSLEAFAWKSSALFGKTRAKPGTSVAGSGVCLHDLSRARGLQLSGDGRGSSVLAPNVFNGVQQGRCFETGDRSLVASGMRQLRARVSSGGARIVCCVARFPAKSA